MEVKNKERFFKYLFIYRSIPFIKYKTNINDIKLNKVIQILNIKNRYKRIKTIILETAEYIDDYYSECSLCDFKNNICICHRKIEKNYQNGCCRMCIYQSSNGCTTKNVACKLFLCSHSIYDKDKLNLEDIYLVKLLDPYQRYILKYDYFSTTEQVATDLYVGPICLIIKIIFRYIYFFFKRRIK